MAILRFYKDLSRKQLMASILLFFVHFVILVAIMAGLLLWREWDHLAAHMKQFGASYLYALFCVLLLIVIMYLYFFFEDRRMLSTGKNIALMFTVLDISFIISWLIGDYIDIFARPVALVALMICVLVGRRAAVFMNIINALLVFVADTFAGGLSADSAYYSSLLISFSAGMLAIFFCEQAKTRFRVVLVGIAIVIPIEIIIFLLEVSTFIENVGNGWQALQGIFRDDVGGLDSGSGHTKNRRNL